MLRSTTWVMQRARSVRLSDAGIARWAERAHFDDEADHASPLDELTGTRDEIANLILLTDALNFCFWSARPLSVAWRGARVERFLAFAAVLAEAVLHDRRWLEPAYWADMTRARFEAILPRDAELLMLDERVAVLRETGQGASALWQGSFAHAAEEAGGDSGRLAALLAERLPSFRDVARYDGKEVALLKRAQLCAADLAWAWARRGLGAITGLERLTAFADYRLPQVLTHLGIIEVSSELTQRIECEEELAAGSTEEVELRAATVQAVERMRAAAAARGVAAEAWRIDFGLWKQSHDAAVIVKHHRTRTVYY